VAGMFKAKVPVRSDAEIKAALDEEMRRTWRDRS
jgi:hypothetical protein